MALLLSLVNAIILAVLLWQVIPHTHIIIWLLAFSSIIILRLVAVFYVTRQLKSMLPELIPAQEKLLRWRSWFHLGVFFTACCWGAAGYFLFPDDSPMHIALIAVVLSGTVAAGMTTLSWVRDTFPLFLFPVLAPFALRIGAEGTAISLAIALMTCLFTLLLLHSSSAFYRTSTDSIRLRFENLDLVEELYQANLALQAEQAALHEAQDYYRDIFETVNEGIYLATPEGHLLRANPALVKIHNFDEESELLAAVNQSEQSWYVDPERFKQYQNRMEQHGHVENFISEVYRLHDRQTIWISENARVISKADGSYRRYQGTVRDITEQKKAELVLVAAKESAEDAARLKSEFLATISHEIRTPMHGVLGMTELLQATKLDNKQRRYADAIQRSGELLMRIIDDILDVSKIEAGKLNLDLATFYLADLLAEITEEFSAHAEHKGIEFKLDASIDMHQPMLGDRDRVLQIISNLLSNAFKFTEQGYVKLSARLEPVDNTTAVAYFAVEDTGIGIPEELQAHIFDAFMQADSSLTRNHQGTGLGLAICKQLVELMNGEIHLSSIPDGGSTFYFTLRLGLITDSTHSNDSEQS